MSLWLSVINFAAVGLFGTLLSAAFCDVTWTKQNKIILGTVILILGSLQVVLLTDLAVADLRGWYPFITHLPLVFVLYFLTRQKLWSIIAVLMAYLCCQFRRWVALLCVTLFNGGEMMQDAVELLVTLPFLVLLLRHCAPAVRGMSHYPLTMQLQFGVIPAVGYVFDYMTRIYTDWLIIGLPVATEFMLLVCAVVQLAFAIWGTQALRERSEMEQIQAVLDLQVKQSAQQIADMKRSQDQAAAQRHDLRHHLQYLDACLKTGAVEQAQEYIRSLHREISSQPVTQYCENTAANLILSSFAGRAAEEGATFSAQVRLGAVLRISDNDLCVLLSNALENALNACIEVSTQGKSAAIEVRGYTKEDRVLLEVSNTFGDSLILENGVPVTRQQDHGVGVRSIIAITEKYGGIYLFDIENDRFLLRLSI